jgi:hypothetical protein
MSCCNDVFSAIAISFNRAAVIGGVVKGLNGLLPASFALPVGIPDLLFGLSALVLALLWKGEGWSARTLIARNLIGMAVIMPAPILGQLGLPGPFHLFTSIPDARAVQVSDGPDSRRSSCRSSSP